MAEMSLSVTGAVWWVMGSNLNNWLSGNATAVGEGSRLLGMPSPGTSFQSIKLLRAPKSINASKWTFCAQLQKVCLAGRALRDGITDFGPLLKLMLHNHGLIWRVVHTGWGASYTYCTSLKCWCSKIPTWKSSSGQVTIMQINTNNISIRLFRYLANVC